MRTIDFAPYYRPPSASTGCFRRSTSSAAWKRGAELSALQHRADRRERLSHLRCRRRLHRRRTLDRGEGEHVDDPGEKLTNDEEKNGDLLYQGIAGRNFERSFQLAEHVEVKGASLENGLLHVDLAREVPEAMKSRAIPIASSRKVLEVKPTQAAA